MKCEFSTVLSCVSTTLWFTSLTTVADAFPLHRVSISTSLPSSDHRPVEGGIFGMISHERRRIENDRGSVLFLREPSTPETRSDSEEDDQLRASERDEVELSSIGETFRKVGGNILEVSLYGFSFFMNIVGLYFVAGLVLNIFGFAYEFSLKDGYKISTIEDKRIELQFQRESMRYEKEWNEKMARLEAK